MMSAVNVVVVFLVVLLALSALCEDSGDDEIKGPLMPQCGGRLCDTVELIAGHGHKGERHTVTTDDGYVLTVFRIVPTTQPASVVLLQHGFLCSSDCWLTDADSLAFKLSDAGFDVWINNVRGNSYSRSHTTLKPEDKNFWNFSWHEMGSKDLPAVIDYILKTTNESKVHYVGHSLGTTIGYLLTSSQPQYNQHLKSVVALAPVVFLSRMVMLIGPDGLAGWLAKKYMKDFKASGKLEVFPRKDLATNDDLQITCNDIEEGFRDMCVEKLEAGHKLMGGAYMPAGQSFKTLDHLYQMSVYGSMRYYNMSVDENKAAYDSEEPPVYTDKFNQISAPTLLWSSEADQLITFADVDSLTPLLPNLVSDKRIKEECFDHLAFLFPMYKSCVAVREKLYSDIVQALNKLESN